MKYKHKVKTDSYVWCDWHCTVHAAERDFYGEGEDSCCPTNWRKVYIASDDKKEEF